jgi:hypothetical protein
MSKTCQREGCDRGCYGEFCMQHKPRKAIQTRTRLNPIGKRGLANQQTTKAWREQNTEFVCYLRISPMCLINLDEQTAVPEHVKPKSKSTQAEVHDITKIRAACTFCNALKGSRTIESLAKDFPHLLVLT